MESDDMGRIKTKPVKRATNQLIKAYPAGMTKSFAENKLYVDKYMDAKSKKIRNTIAGYVTRLAKEATD